MPSDPPSKPTTSPFKRKSPPSPDTTPDSPDPTETKKSKTDPTVQRESPTTPPSTPLLGTASFPSDSELMPPPPPPSPRSPPSRLPTRPGTSQVTPQHLETALHVLRNKRPPLLPPSRRPASAVSHGLDAGAANRFNAREATRTNAASHLQRAREQLLEDIFCQGLDRSVDPIVSATMNRPTASPSPPASPSPSHKSLPSPPLLLQSEVKEERREGGEGLGITGSGFDSATFVRGTGEQEGESSGERVSKAPAMGEGAWVKWAETLRAAAEKAREETARTRGEMASAREETERVWREEVMGREEKEKEKEKRSGSGKEAGLERCLDASGGGGDGEKSTIKGEGKGKENET
ncbi:MAG: hypothetical protein L6R36_005329 [Xanthoria steineri]|nr:MAG: hypothetical protein L6R36_005329 [Xanthoria steineri]